MLIFGIVVIHIPRLVTSDTDRVHTFSDLDYYIEMIAYTGILLAYFIFNMGKQELSINMVLIISNVGVTAATISDLRQSNQPLYLTFLLFAFVISIAFGGLRLGTILYTIDLMVVIAYVGLFDTELTVNNLLLEAYMYIVFIPIITSPMIYANRSLNTLDKQQEIATIQSSYEYFVEFMKGEIDQNFSRGQDLIDDLITHLNDFDNDLD